MNKRPDWIQNGFTLLEIMISLVLIGLVVVSVMELSSANLRSLARSDDRIETLHRLNAKMRDVLDCGEFEDKSRQETDADGFAYDIAMTEIMKDRSDALGVKLVQITVSAQDTKNKDSKKITLKTAKLVSKAAALNAGVQSGRQERSIP